MTQKKSVTELSDLYKLIPGTEPLPVEEKIEDPLAPLNIRLHVRLEKKGRGGKAVTVIEGFFHTRDELENLARELKTHCGAGGTVRGDTVEIQGSQVEKVREFLKKKGFKLKGR
jgi:translation initiation factor 1